MSFAIERLRALRAGRLPPIAGAPQAESAARQSALVKLGQAPAGPQVHFDAKEVTQDDLPADWWLWYEARAAIQEYDSGQVCEHAEAEAMAETVRAMRAAGEIPCDTV